MTLAGRGDQAACQVLVERHLGRIVSFVRRSIDGGVAEAEDLAQEVFLRVWAAAPRWKPEARFTTWLYKVAVNLCIDFNAKRREMPGYAPDDVPDLRAEPFAALQQSELAHHVRAAVVALPAAQRTAIMLCHYQGMRNSEAAGAMGLTVEALESLLVRARRAIGLRLRPVAHALLCNE